MRSTLLALVALVAGLAVAGAMAAQSGDADDDAAAVWTVNSAADPGDGVCDDTCTLRDALLAANDRAGPDRIAFAIGRGLAVIRPLSPLPPIADADTVVDGATQPGFAGRPLIFLDGSAAARASGLVSMAARTWVRSIGVGDFPRYGLAAIGEDAVDVHFVGNWVGLAADGRSAAPNRLSGIAVLLGAKNAHIGDGCTGCGNRIAGNGNADRTGHGVLVAGAGSVGARIVGNVIGLTVDGAALPNDDGVLVVDGGHATVGGRSPDERNVISGNTVAGVEVRDAGFLTMRIEGNYIGLDESGARAIPNDVGLFVNGNARLVEIGAATASAANVVSGNRVGIAIEQFAHAVTVRGNMIGLDAEGRAAVPNSEDGISVVAGAREVVIGGAEPGAGNWIAGNGNAIVVADRGTSDVRVQGNTLGLATDGIVVIPNQTGISVREAGGVLIGGRQSGAGNRIVGTVGTAIRLAAVVHGEVRGNVLGLRADGRGAPNGVGVQLESGTTESVIESNRIGPTLGAGVAVLDGTSQRNRISRNAYLNNAGLGIDLGGDGHTSNDVDDADEGPNRLLNAPAILAVRHDGIRATVSGTAPRRAEVELYAINPRRPPFSAPHPSGFGAGGELLGTARADASGVWELVVVTDPGAPLTALAIDPGGNTSEFGRNVFPETPVLLLAGFTPAGWFGPEMAAAEAFAPLGSRLVAAFRFNAAGPGWEIYRRALPLISTLDRLQPGDAFWIQLGPGPRTAWAQDEGPVGARAVILLPGLNFVTWTGPPTPVAEAIASLGGAVEVLWRWDFATRRFELLVPRLGLPGQLRRLEPKDVLWLGVDRPVAWEQPAR